MCTSRRIELWLGCALACAGCAVGPNFTRPAAPAEKRYVAEPQTAPGQRIDESNQLAADWWRLLRSPAIDRLVAEARANNPTLEAAHATLRKSQDALRAGYGIFSPQLDASLGASRQQATPSRFGINSPPTVFNLFSLSATVSYTFDLWGGQRRTVESLRAQAEAQRYQTVGAELMLSGNVVSTAIAQAAYRAELEVTRELIALEDEQVRLSETQALAGTTSYASALALKSQVAATRATLPPLEQKIDQAQHLLATLVGRAPASFDAPPVALDELVLPDEIPLSLPSELVRQRPDILTAEAQLHSSTAQIGVATAALLPNLTLSAGVGANNASIGDLFSASSLFWSIAGAIAQPLFRGGTLWYQRKEAIDARDAALANYRQAVLAAFAQVADALRGLQHDADAVSAETEAVEAAKASLDLVQIDYQSGLASYLQVLTADAQYLQARIGLIEARAQRLQDTVALFVALGGGWWNARPAANGARATVERAPVLLLFGAPGAGKSTQAQRLSAAHGLPIIATGELLRAEVARGTPLGERVEARQARGELVPDDVVDALVAERAARPDCARGFILDGYPRTVAQARFLARLLGERGFAAPTVLHLDAPDDVLIARLADRGRADDTREAVARRLAIYRAESAPILATYRGGDYHLIRADQPRDDVFRELEAALPRALSH